MLEFESALIIGGAGFLGSHLAWDLVERGCSRVTVYDCRAPVPRTRLPPSCTILVGDMMKEFEEKGALYEALRNHQVVFHVASPPYHLNDRSVHSGRIGVDQKYRRLFYDVNVRGTERLLDLCRRAGIQVCSVEG